MSDPLGAMRSMLYVPAHRPEMVAKTVRWRPDLVVVDLEDAVPATEKHAARELAVRAIDELDAPAGTTVLIRVNPVGSPWFAEDVAAPRPPGSAWCCPAGAGRTARRAARPAGRRRLPGRPCGRRDRDRARGGRPRALVADGVVAVYFGAEDFISDVGGRRTASGHEVWHARAAVLLACHLAGIPAIDQAVVAVRDDDWFRADAAAGRDLGYQGKICVHPRQVELAHEVFTPSEREVEHARAVLDAGATGVAVLDGEMVDEVHLRLARAALARAGRDAGLAVGGGHSGNETGS